MNLLEMKCGYHAVIDKLPDGEAGQRLEALGLRSGKKIEKVSSMPFGGPVTVMLEGRHFAVSHSIAGQIEINGERKSAEKE
ncbi:MAG: FeoA family protein [Synergistaceae bacterium]|nr:FeoA family protein [Synergistaceae bacterium]